MAAEKNIVEPVVRALRILEELNRDTVMSLERLHKGTGLPKPTLVRLLDTLIAAGYVRRLSRTAGYSLAGRVLKLTRGFRNRDRVAEVGRPILRALTAKHKWPTGLATFDGKAMLVLAGTGHKSPLSTDPNYLGSRLPMLYSALGRAYLAFCPEEEREMILARMRASSARGDVPARDQKAVARLLAQIRAQGFASTEPRPEEPAMGLAVPIMQGNMVIACITMRYFGSAMTEKEAARRYLAPMREAAASIAEALEDAAR